MKGSEARCNEERGLIDPTSDVNILNNTDHMKRLLNLWQLTTINTEVPRIYFKSTI